MGVSDPIERRDEADEEEAEPGVLPYLDVRSLSDAQVQVRAGWASEEQIEELAIDAVVGPSVGQDQMLTAFSWWLERWGEIFQASQQPAEEAEQEAA